MRPDHSARRAYAGGCTLVPGKGEDALLQQLREQFGGKKRFFACRWDKNGKKSEKYQCRIKKLATFANKTDGGQPLRLWMKVAKPVKN